MNINQLPRPRLPAPATTLLSVSMFDHLGISCKWNPTGLVLLGLPDLTEPHSSRCMGTSLSLVIILPVPGGSQGRNVCYQIKHFILPGDGLVVGGVRTQS